MTYATRQSMIERYTEEVIIELTDRAEPSTGDIVDSVLIAALTGADALINAYIAKRYKLPLASTPELLRLLAEVLTYYRLCNGHYTDQTRDDYEDAVSTLKQIAAGTAVLDIEGNEPASAPAEAMVEGPPRMFNRETLGEM